MSSLPFFASLGVVLLTELGDKTQLATFTLSTKYGRPAVFAGAMLAVCVVDGLGILAGAASGGILPVRVSSLLASALFMTFGAWTLLRRGGPRHGREGARGAFLSSFLLISLMEVGDKTQVSTFALSVEYRAPLWIFLGAVLAYSLLMGTGVMVGGYLGRHLREETLRRFSGTLFLLLGLLLLLKP